MKELHNRPVYLYSVSFPLKLLIVIAVCVTGYFVYRSYRDDIYFYLNRNKVNFDVNEKFADKIPELSTVNITEKELNDILDEKVEGTGVGNETVTSADAVIHEGVIDFKGYMSDATEINARIGLSEDKTDIIIQELTLNDTGVMAKVKETLIRTFLKATVENLIKHGENSGYARTEIKPGEIVIYFSGQDQEL